MSSNGLSMPNGNTTDGERQPPRPRRKETVGAAVNEGEKAIILRGLRQCGWAQSEGVREVLLAHAESVAVRDAVADHHASVRPAA